MKLPIPVPVAAAVTAGLVALGGVVAASSGVMTSSPTPAQLASSSSTTTSSTMAAVGSVDDDGTSGVDVSGPCDEVEHADDPRCTGVAPAPAPIPASSDDRAGATPTSADGMRSFSAGSAGTVSYTLDGRGFRLVAASPAPGWVVAVEQAAGDELDLDFRQGSVRVQVDVELEDGQVRERVRVRDDATDDRTESEVLVGAPAPIPGSTPVDDDRGGDDHGGDVERDDRVEAGDDRSGSGPGSGDDGDDDRSGSNRGSDDDADGDDDHGGEVDRDDRDEPGDDRDDD